MEHLFSKLLIILSISFTLSGQIFSQAAQPATEVLILGTSHLSGMKEFQPSMLNGMIGKLDSLDFSAICIENMSTELLMDIQNRNDSAFMDLVQGFGGDRLQIADSIRQLEGLNYYEAKANINLLEKVSPLTDSTRLVLIKNFLAVSDIASACIHYNVLLKKRANTKEMLGSYIDNTLSNYSRSKNEIYALALPLALKEELLKVEYIDNFQDEALLLKHFPLFIQDYLNNKDKFKKVAQHPIFIKADSIKNQAIEDENLYALYKFLNGKEYQKLDYEAQWQIWLSSNFQSGSDYARYSLWEMRNLQIAANIAKTAAFYPNKKILVIIGASHKSFLEKYLKQMPTISLLEL